MQKYIKRGAAVSAEPFDPTRDDQGVSVTRDADTNFVSAAMQSGGRGVGVNIGDVLVTDAYFQSYPMPTPSFNLMFQPLADVVEAAISAGGN